MSTSSSGSTNHNKRQSLETDNSQRVLDNDSAQHLKLRERQRFFEEVYQHDMDFLLSSAHLHVDSRKQVDDEEEDEEDESKEVVYRERVPTCDGQRGSKSRMSSTSSGSSDTSGGGTDTHVVQSDDEEVQADTLLLTSVPRTKDEETEEEEEEE